MATATTPLVPKQIDSVMQNVTINALGLLPGPAAYKAVRVGWQQQGQPAFKIGEDAVAVMCIEVDDPYNRIRDWDTVTTPGNPNPPTVDLLTLYTRRWESRWVFYGPNCFDHARIVHSALLRPDQEIHDLLVTSNLYLVTDMASPRYLPELGPGGQWWERTDFEARFYENVTERVTVGTVKSVEVIVEDSSGVLADLTFTGS